MDSKAKMIVGGLALGFALVLSGCTGHGEAPRPEEKRAERCRCGAPKGSPECKCAMMKKQAPKEVAEHAAVPQSTCPAMGGPVSKELYVEKGGRRIYVCCGGCVATVKGDFDKFARKIEAGGETVEVVKQPVLCMGCGQVKGSDSCCKAGTPKCAKCGHQKGSPGCCKIG